MAAVAGVMPSIIAMTKDGRLPLDKIQSSIRYANEIKPLFILRKVDDHFPTSKLIIIENTANMAGGSFSFFLLLFFIFQEYHYPLNTSMKLLRSPIPIR